MPTSLTGNKISQTYPQIIHVDGGVTGTAKALYDGDGTATVLKVSTSEVEISGNLTIAGTLTNVNTTNLQVDDSLIQLGRDNNSSDVVDIGFVGLYDAGGTDKYAGLFRDANDSGKFKLFIDSQEDLSTTNTINTSATGYTVATLVANLEAATVNIDGGNIDGTTIATSDITVGTGKTLNVSGGTLTLANDQISGDAINGGTIGSVTISQLAGALDANNQAITNVNIDSGAIDSTNIGAGTPGTGAFTTLSANGDVNFDSGTFFVDVSADKVGIQNTAPHRALDVMDNAAGLTYPLRIYNDSATSATHGVGIQFGCDSYGADGVGDEGKGALAYEISTSFARGKFHFLQNTDADRGGAVLADAVMTIQNDGKTGFGTTSPTNVVEIEFNDTTDTHVAANIVDNSASGLVINNTANNTGLGGIIKMSSNDGGNITAIAHTQEAATSASLRFFTESSGTFAERMKIDHNGEVFFAGTGSYVAEFQGDVKILDNNSDARLLIGDTVSGGDYCEISWDSSDDKMKLGVAGDEGTLVLDTNGRVAIGHSSPNELLHVEGSSPSIRIKASNAGGLAELKLESDQGTNNEDLWSLRADPAHEFKIMSNSTGSFSSHAVFRLTETEFAKDVGIGAAPSANLDVRGTSSKPIVNFGDADVRDADATDIFGSGSFRYQFQNGNSSRPAIIEGGGDVGTNESVVYFTGFSSSQDDGHRNLGGMSIFRKGTSTSGKEGSQLQFRTKADNTATPAQNMTLDENGRLGIGTSSPNYRFKVEGSEATWLQNISNTASSGNAFCQQLQFTGVSPNNTTSKFQQFVDGGSTVRFEVRSNGGVVNFQSNDADFSDESVKKDITDAPSYLETVNNIKVRNFKYKDQSDDRTLIGVIAQEVEAVDSSLVDGSEELKRVYNKDIMFMMLKAVQELSAKVTELENKLGD